MSALPESLEPQPSPTEVLESCFDNIGELLGRAALLRNEIIFSAQPLPEAKRLLAIRAVNEVMALMQDAQIVVDDIINDKKVVTLLPVEVAKGADYEREPTEDPIEETGQQEIDNSESKIKNVILDFNGVSVNAREIGITNQRDLEIMRTLPAALKKETTKRSDFFEAGYHSVASRNSRNISFSKHWPHICQTLNNALGYPIVKQKGNRGGSKYIPQVTPKLVLIELDNPAITPESGAKLEIELPQVEIMDSEQSKPDDGEEPGTAQEDDGELETQQTYHHHDSAEALPEAAALRQAAAPYIRDLLAGKIGSKHTLGTHKMDLVKINEVLRPHFGLTRNGELTGSTLTFEELVPNSPYTAKLSVREALKFIADGNNPKAAAAAQAYLGYIDEN